METKFIFIKLSVGHVFCFLFSGVFDVSEHTDMVQSTPTNHLELCLRASNIFSTADFPTLRLVTFNLSGGRYCGTWCPTRQLFYTRPMLTAKYQVKSFYAIFQCFKKSHENCLETFITFFELIYVFINFMQFRKKYI